MSAARSRWADGHPDRCTEENKEQCPTAVEGRPAWPRCPHTWLAGLDAHGLEASGEDGRVGHVGVEALLLPPVDQHHDDEEQGQTQGHGHHPDVQRHVLHAAHSCDRRGGGGSKEINSIRGANLGR